jgi:hypothetical protein
MDETLFNAWERGGKIAQELGRKIATIKGN